MDSPDELFALVLIDLQPEWYSRSHVSKLFPELGDNVKRLLGAVRKMDCAHVVHVRAKYAHDSSPWSKWMKHFKALNPEKTVEIDGTSCCEPFAKEVGGEKVFIKPTFDAFQGTALHEYLKERGIQKVKICGLITSVCVQATAFGFFTRGYQIDLVRDCCGDRSLERHRAALMLYGNYMYRVISSKEVIGDPAPKRAKAKLSHAKRRRNKKKASVVKKESCKPHMKLVVNKASNHAHYSIAFGIALLACIAPLLRPRALQYEALKNVAERTWSDDLVTSHVPFVVRANDVPFSLPVEQWSWDYDSNLHAHLPDNLDAKCSAASPTFLYIDDGNAIADVTWTFETVKKNRVFSRSIPRCEYFYFSSPVPGSGKLAKSTSDARKAMCDQTCAKQEFNMWISSQNVETAAHYDLVSNVFAQIHGVKTFVLFPPKMVARGMKLHPSGSSANRQSNLDLSGAFFRNAPLPSAMFVDDAFVAILHPGDVLILPPCKC